LPGTKNPPDSVPSAQKVDQNWTNWKGVGESRPLFPVLY
jgi:hypothetical protein